MKKYKITFTDGDTAILYGSNILLAALELMKYPESDREKVINIVEVK